MTLLREVMDHPLDPSYAASAAAGRPASRRGKALSLLLAVVAGAAFVTSVSSIRQPQRQSSVINSHLRDQITKRTAEVERQEATNAALSQAIALVQKSALGANGARLAAQAQTLGLAVGEVPVTGPGLRLTLDDAPGRNGTVGSDPRATGQFDGGTILDADLQVVVNGLWAAGAEAIAVNGERLTALSAIRSAGKAILVDFRPLVPPYVIEAIGDPAQLQAGFAASSAGPYVQSMRDNNGIRADIAAIDKLVLPAAGQLVLRTARPAK
jgi:uncharacterized protein YlxW (UPF0749 family)